MACMVMAVVCSNARAAQLVSGPMIGHTTDTSVSIWARTDVEAKLTVRLSASADLARPVASKEVATVKADDYTAVAKIAGLTPATRYFYNIFMAGKPVLSDPLPSFRTFPKAGKPAKFRVAFGGGIRFQVDPVQKAWNDIAARKPDLMLLMGDNTYPDNSIAQEKFLSEVELAGNERLLIKKKNGWRGGSGYLFHRVYYRIQQSLPIYRRFTGRHPIYAVWDDHDAYHDGTGGARIPLQQRLESIQTFRENFAQPYYGGGSRDPGVWCHFSVADVDFFLLDARTYRTHGGGRDARFLGEAEEAWLKDRLKQSTAKFKFLVCGSPWNNQPKTGPKVLTDENYYDASGDTLASFKWHRDEILKWIIAEEIPGVILLSGDRHRADIVKVWPRSMPEKVFYDLNNCNIASRTQSSVGEPGDNGLVFSYSGRCFGLLDVDTTVKPARVVHEIWSAGSNKRPAAMKYRFLLEATDMLPRPVTPE